MKRISTTKRRRKPKRRYGPLTETDVLNMLLDGELVVNTATAEAFRAAQPDRLLTTRPCHRGYLHVRIYKDGRRRSVALHRLVWMAANRQCVPANHQIHHGKLGKLVNGIHNLLLQHADEHGWYHAYVSSAEHRKNFRTFDDFREWKRQQPVAEFVFD